jgi:cell division protein FtsA
LPNPHRKRYTACMRENNLPHFVGLDVGTSTVRCVVGTVNPADGDDNRPSVIGHGSAPNTGMRKGMVVHIDDAAEAIVQAITEAERVSGMQISAATINVNGSHVSGMNSKGVIAISAANREITDEDRMRVEEAATVVKLPPNREIIQVFAKNYSLDGQSNIKDPVGMHGVRLEVDTHIVSAATPSIRNLNMALSKAQITPNHLVVSSLAAAEAVLGRQQKEAGTVLIDIGAGTTNLVVVEDGEVQHVAVIPIGGSHLTNDLAIGLKTDLDIAESVKLTHASVGHSGAAKKGVVYIDIGDERHAFKAPDVYMIVEARIEELFEYVEKELQSIKRARKLPGGIVIVGGTAKLPGVAEFAREQLQLPARIGKLQPLSGLIDTVDEPAYATAVGLMLLDMLLPSEANQSNQQQTMMGDVNGVFNKLTGFFRK